MPLVVGVSFRKAGKIYYFDPAGLELAEGDSVIAETARGIEFGEVMIDPRDVPEEEIVPPLKKIVRKAAKADIDRAETFRLKEKQAYHTCQQKIQFHNLPMKLIDAEYCFDGSQITFYFSAEARVDFRELVKDLCGALRAKVQLHQVGVRDEAKLFGGLGPCGRSLCCASFLAGFEPVSMKMAKEQCLFLNPLKFSGICGKLMCCLKYEYPVYKEAKQRLPAMGSMITTEAGIGKVVELHVIKEAYSVALEDGKIVHCTVKDDQQVECLCPSQQNGSCVKRAVEHAQAMQSAQQSQTVQSVDPSASPARSRPPRPPRPPRAPRPPQPPAGQAQQAKPSQPPKSEGEQTDQPAQKRRRRRRHRSKPKPEGEA